MISAGERSETVSHPLYTENTDGKEAMPMEVHREGDEGDV